jgi:glycosyltransferase involved in cell wall biosynthesis
MTVDYSVIIPAYNEEDFLPLTLEHLKAAMAAVPARGEIIVVDNNSNDGTSRIARQNGAIVVFEPINQISRARNSGARQARGKFLIFLDADTTITRELLAAALDQLSGGRCCGGGVLVKPAGEPPAAARFVLDLWNRLSMKLGLAAGCFVYCLREAFQQIGGFSERVYASEEIWFSRKLRSWGGRNNMRVVIIDAHPITTSLRKLQWYSAPKLIMLSAPILLFPPAVFFRSLCSTWYKRPGRENKV